MLTDDNIMYESIPSFYSVLKQIFRLQWYNILDLAAIVRNDSFFILFLSYALYFAVVFKTEHFPAQFNFSLSHFSIDIIFLCVHLCQVIFFIYFCLRKLGKY